MYWFNHSHEKILVHLARFKFLTNSQFQLLGVMKSCKKINEKKNDLKKRGLLKSIEYQKALGLEYVHHLSLKGKRLLIHEFGLESEEIRMPV